MRVGFDASRISGHDGISRYSRAIINELLRSYPQMEVVLLSTFSKSRLRRLKGVFGEPANLEIKPVLPNPMALGNSLKSFVSHIRSLLLNFHARKMDVLHLTVPFADRVGASNIVLTVHDLFPLLLDEYQGEEAYREFRRNAGFMIRKAAAVITPTEYISRQVSSLFPAAEGKTHVVSHGVDPVFRPGGEPGADTPPMMKNVDDYFLYVGSSYPRKNLRKLLEAWSILKTDAGIRIRLVLVMSGVERHIRRFSEFLEDYDTPGVIRLEGVEDPTLSQLYSGAKALVFPSREEGFGLPVLEAMKSGCPVITSRASCLPEVAGEAALYIDPEDEVDIAKAMARILEEPEIIARLVKAGATRAELFSWEKCAEETYRIYKAVSASS
ncbi:MAG: glycosyltransferase [Candidatus Aegiribacteria sp.]|nr:glycosyltransferase [Candidatus Aegiribacteria sp.]MBD3295448.1 glycosyltransferase [Candidatus Fermentibacteria bacterium]